MNRNFGKENMEPQQPTEPNDHYVGPNAEQHGAYSRRVVQHVEEGDAAATERAVTHQGYANSGNYATNDPRDTTTAARRYTISAAPGEGPNVVSERHGAQPPHPRAGSMAGVGSDLMGNHSQRSIPGQTIHPGYREMPGTPGQVPGYEQPLSPHHFVHRMSLGQFYPMSAGGASPSYPMNEMGDLSGRGGSGGSNTGAPSAAAPAPGASASAASNNAGGSQRGEGEGAPPTNASAPGGLSQADHEEELLLNLLITRRQRSRMAGGNAKGGNGGQPQLSLADEIMRMRQQRPQVPGMPPLYADQQQSLPNAPPYQEYRVIKQEGGGQGGYGAPPASYHPHHPHAAHFATHPHPMRAPPMHGGGGEMDRIDRSPGRFHTMDARMDMRDFSERSAVAAGGYKQHQHHRYMAAAHHHHHHGGGHPPMSYDMYAVDMALAAAATDAPPPPKKKRAHKKKPADMPRRPLSAYNLFFSEERERILKEIEKGEGKGKDGEDAGDGSVKAEDNASLDKGDKAEKPKALLRPLIPSQKKRRPHRKTHGKISFQDLARMVGERWKNLPDDDRKYYQDLAQEDMKRQKAAMEEYYAKQNNEKTTGNTSTTSGDNNGAAASAGMATVDA